MSGRMIGAWMGSLLTVVVSSAHARIVTFAYSGYVDIIKDTNSILDGSIQLGTPFSASYSFESDTLPGYIGEYGTSYYDALRSYELTIGNYTVTGVGLYDRIMVADNGDGQDEFLVVNTPVLFAGQWVTIGQDLYDGNDAAMTSLDLPTVPPRLEDFASHEFGLLTSTGSLGISGVITSLTPEPSSLLLLAGGACAMSRRSRRRQSRSNP